MLNAPSPQCSRAKLSCPSFLLPWETPTPSHWKPFRPSPLPPLETPTAPSVPVFLNCQSVELSPVDDLRHAMGYPTIETLLLIDSISFKVLKFCFQNRIVFASFYVARNVTNFCGLRKLRTKNEFLRIRADKL